MTPAAKQSAPTLQDLLLAVLSGLLLTASFPPGRLSFLAWIALVPLLIAIRDKSSGGALKLGFITGFFPLPDPHVLDHRGPRAIRESEPCRQSGGAPAVVPLPGGLPGIVFLSHHSNGSGRLRPFFHGGRMGRSGIRQSPSGGPDFHGAFWATANTKTLRSFRLPISWEYTGSPF